MVSTELKMSMIIAGRGARACDMCGKERAKWYCAADDAYLCENCDESVHSANSVAKRHERVRLGANGAPVKLKPSHCHNKNVKSRKFITITSEATPSTAREVDDQKWCSSSRKRSKTARRSTNVCGHSFLNCIVPAKAESSTLLIKDLKKDFIPVLDDHMCMDDHSGMAPCEVKLDPSRLSSILASRARSEVNGESFEYNHEVPTYEPLLADLIDSSQEDLMKNLVPSSPPVCNASFSSRASTSTMKRKGMIPANDRKFEKQGKPSFEADGKFQSYDLVDGNVNDVNEGVLIGEDSDIDTFDVTELCSNAEFVETVKLEELNEDSTDGDCWIPSGHRDQGTCLGFFQGNRSKGKRDRDRDPGCMDAHDKADPLRQCSQQANLHSPLSLRLDFEEIISAWSDRGSMWLDGQRPQIVPDIDFTSRGIADCDMIAVAESICSRTRRSQPGQVPSLVVLDKGREARVLRYKEKRRTRLFSKRIRYEVRKLNAECRPRMKGRFVKRAAIAAMGAGRPQARV